MALGWNMGPPFEKSEQKQREKEDRETNSMFGRNSSWDNERFLLFHFLCMLQWLQSRHQTLNISHEKRNTRSVELTVGFICHGYHVMIHLNASDISRRVAVRGSFLVGSFVKITVHSDLIVLHNLMTCIMRCLVGFQYCAGANSSITFMGKECLRTLEQTSW